jgi:putative PIN family toxin of toxin-antitoxin system
VRVVLDTNVLVSGIFFAGVPGQILDAWGKGQFVLIATPSIFAEYEEVCRRLHARFPSIEFDGVLVSLLLGARIVADPDSGPPISRDPDDDIFLRCAHATRSVVVSGDEDLLEQDGWSGVRVIKPRDFLEELNRP